MGLQRATEVFAQQPAAAIDIAELMQSKHT